MVRVPVLQKYGRHRDRRHSRPRQKMNFDVNYSSYNRVVVERYARIYTATGRTNKCGVGCGGGGGGGCCGAGGRFSSNSSSNGGSGGGGGGGGGSCCEIFVIWFAFTLIMANTLTIVSSRTTNNDDTDAGDTTSSISNGDNNVSAAASTSSCPNCLISRDQIRAYTLEDIKQQILIKLGFTEGTPNISNKMQHNDPAVKPFMDKMNDTNRRDDDDEHMKTMYLVAIAKACTSDFHCRKLKNQNPIAFVFEQKTVQSKLISAWLHFYQKPYPESLTTDVKMNITIFKFNHRSASSSNPFTPLTTMEATLTSEGRWIQIEVTEYISKHFKERDITNISLVIMAPQANKNMASTLVTDLRKDENSSFVPYLKLQIEEQRSQRNKRSTSHDCTEDNTQKTCCRYPLTVDFEDFKFDFIIAPRTYDAYYCSGECSYLVKQEFPHTHLVQMSSSHAHSPCCGPRKMAPISLLYYNNYGNIVFGEVPGMVVERCGCT